MKATETILLQAEALPDGDRGLRTGMDDSKKKETQGGAKGNRKLRELAREASVRLDSIFHEGKGPETAEGSKAAERRAVAKSTQAAGPAGKRDAGVRDRRSAASPRASERGAGESGIGPSVAAEGEPRRGEGVSGSPAGPGSAKSPRILVSHVSPGVAGTLANILKSEGMSVQVVSSPEGLDSSEADFKWDVIFVQGSPMPYPGIKLISTTLRRCADSGTPLVLLTSPGEAPLHEAAEFNVLGSLEWPFDRRKVQRILADLVDGPRVDDPESRR